LVFPRFELFCTIVSPRIFVIVVYSCTIDKAFFSIVVDEIFTAEKFDLEAAATVSLKKISL
jgi:hypothetical protein